MEFLEYELRSDMLCLGERTKKGTFKPTITTIPYSQITGAIKAYLGKDRIWDKENEGVHAVGYLCEYKKAYLTYSPRDRSINSSKLPIVIEYLIDVVGKVYVLKTEDTKNMSSSNDPKIKMGALKSKGFGNCVLKKINGGKTYEFLSGLLNTRIPIEMYNIFGIQPIKERYGYLFKPTSDAGGVYVKSLFEGSKIKGPKFLLTTNENGR